MSLAVYQDPEPWGRGAALAALDRVQRVALRPPSNEPIADWCERELELRVGALPGRYDLTQRTPYMRGVLEAVADPTVRTVVLRFASQTGKTHALLGIMAYLIANDPGPMLWVAPTLQDAAGVSKERIARLFEQDVLAAYLRHEYRTVDADRSTLRRSFIGGALSMVGANAASGLSSRPIRYLFGDEIDRWSLLLKEGDALALALQRLETFHATGQSKAILSSTPTLKGASRIDAAYDEGSRETFHVPCEYCGAFAAVEWHQLRWPDGRPEAARFFCATCDRPWERIATERGEWRAEGERGETRSFHLPSWYSPFTSPVALAQEWVRVAHVPERRQAFVNLKKAESYAPPSEGVSEHDLAARREPAPDLSTLAIVAGSDVQGDRVETVFLGFGESQVWVLAHEVTLVDIRDPKSHIAIDATLSKWQPVAHAIDSNFLTDYVHAYTKTRLRTFSVRGEDGAVDHQEPYKMRRRKKGSGRTLSIVVNTVKSRLHARYTLGPQQPSALRFAQGLDAVYFEHLTSEELRTAYKKGRPVKFWERIAGRAAEGLDATVYAFALAQYIGGYPKLRALSPIPATTTTKSAVSAQPAGVAKRRRDRFAKYRRGAA